MLRSGRRLHNFLGNLDSGVHPALGLECLDLPGVDRDETMHLFHLFFTIPVGRYSKERIMLAFSRELPPEGIPPVTEIPVEYFKVQNAVCAVLSYYHLVHVEGIPPSIWKMIPCKRAGKHA